MVHGRLSFVHPRILIRSCRDKFESGVEGEAFYPDFLRRYCFRYQLRFASYEDQAGDPFRSVDRNRHLKCIQHSSTWSDRKEAETQRKLQCNCKVGEEQRFKKLNLCPEDTGARPTT